MGKRGMGDSLHQKRPKLILCCVVLRKHIVHIQICAEREKKEEEKDQARREKGKGLS